MYIISLKRDGKKVYYCGYVEELQNNRVSATADFTEEERFATQFQTSQAVQPIIYALLKDSRCADVRYDSI